MKIEKESAAGSRAYARELAACMVESGKGIEIGPTDAGQCAMALRFYAGRWQRRAFVAVAVAIVGALGVGLPDVNGDGRASLADLGAAVRQVVGS